MSKASRWDRVVLLILLIGFGLRVHQLDRLSVWLDESYSIYTALQEWTQGFKFIAAMEHPPLYFIFLRGVIALAGKNEFSYRFPSVIAGVLAITGMYALGKQISTPQLALIAALLTSISPFHVWYSRDARMYELFFAFGLLSSALFFKNLRYQLKLGWVGYSLVSLAGLYTLNMMTLVLLVQWVYFFIHFKSYLHKTRAFFIASIGIAIGYAPWMPVLLVQSQHINQYFWITRPTWQTVRDTFLNFFSAFLFSNSPWHPLVGPWPYNLAYWVFWANLLLGSIFLLTSQKFKIFSWTLLTITIPMGVIYVISLFKPMYLDRTVIFSSAGIILLIAASCSSTLSRWTQWLGLVSLVSMVTINSISLHTLLTRGEKEEWRQAAQLVASKSRLQEVVLIDSGLCQIPFDLYWKQYKPNISTFGYPLDNDHWQTQSFTWNSRWWILDFMQPDLVKARERLNILLADQEKIWLIVNRPLGGQSLQMIIEELGYEVYHKYQFNRIDVILYCPKDWEHAN